MPPAGKVLPENITENAVIAGLFEQGHAGAELFRVDASKDDIRVIARKL